MAMDLIATKGFEGLRFQEVAHEAGINNATLSYHFATKEELILGVMEHLGREMQQTPGRPAERPVSAREELRLEFESVGRLLLKRPKLFVVLIELSMRAMRDPVTGNAVNMMDEHWRQHLTSVIEQGKREGIFRAGVDTETAATVLMAQIKGLGFHALTGKLKPREIERAIAEAARQAEIWLGLEGET